MVNKKYTHREKEKVKPTSLIHSSVLESYIVCRMDINPKKTDVTIESFLQIDGAQLFTLATDCVDRGNA